MTSQINFTKQVILFLKEVNQPVHKTQIVKVIWHNNSRGWKTSQTILDFLIDLGIINITNQDNSYPLYVIRSSIDAEICQRWINVQEKNKISLD